MGKVIKYRETRVTEVKKIVNETLENIKKQEQTKAYQANVNKKR